ncbi:hypothetical protein DIPPA_16860 [Diplonema papillatum]|nr:hypothetical protein DIPPA_16860 [Diplonema papillatum]|eukprot:gene20375-31352_t
MTWDAPRPSILQRALRHNSYLNRENIDEEYRREQAKVLAKRERYEMIDARLRVGNGGARPDEKARLAEEDRLYKQRVIDSKREQQRLEKEREEVAVRTAVQRDASLAVSQLDLRNKKRDYERQIMLDNKALAQSRKIAADEAKRQEQAQERFNADYMTSQPRRYR